MHAAVASSPRGRPAFPRRCSPSTRTCADREGLRSSSERGKALGFFGRAAVHPSQVGTINDVFTPTEGELRAAARTDGRARRRSPRQCRGRGAARRPLRRSRRGRAGTRDGRPGRALGGDTAVSDLLAALARGVEVYDLAQPLEASIPVSPNHPGFRMALQRRHGDGVRPDGSSAASEIIVTGGHVGTHVDALAHVSLHDRLHGGASASAAQREADSRCTESRRWLRWCVGASSSTYPAPGERTSSSPASRSARATLTGHRTGWASRSGPAMPSSSGPAGPVTGAIPPRSSGWSGVRPDPDESAARWLAERRVALTGGETVAYEQIPPGQGHALLPVHVLLLVERGIPIVEMLESRAPGHGRRPRVPVRAPRRSRSSEPPARLSVRSPSSRDEPDAGRVGSASSPFAAASKESRPRSRQTRSGACSTLSATRSPPATLLWRRLCDRSLSAGAGRSRGERDRRRGALSGARRRADQRDAGPLAGLRRHPSALRAPPERVGSCRRRSPSPRHRARSGAEALLAIAVGNEINVRLGSVGYDARRRVNLFFERGLHATSICGALASAATAALLLGLDAAGVADAIGIAASMGAGLLEANRTGGSVKRAHCGWAAHAGICAAELARSGLTGPPTVLEGRFGFFQAYCGDGAAPETLVDGLGERWEVLSVFFKPYPCNHFTHPGSTRRCSSGARAWSPTRSPRSSSGRRRLSCARSANPTRRRSTHALGTTPSSAAPSPSPQRCSAGAASASTWTTSRTSGPATRSSLELAARVRCVPDEECDRIFPLRFPARLRVRLHSGETLERFVPSSRGGPEQPLSDDELGRKFELNASRAARLSGRRAARARRVGSIRSTPCLG